MLPRAYVCVHTLCQAIWCSKLTLCTALGSPLCGVVAGPFSTFRYLGADSAASLVRVLLWPSSATPALGAVLGPHLVLPARPAHSPLSRPSHRTLAGRRVSPRTARGSQHPRAAQSARAHRLRPRLLRLQPGTARPRLRPRTLVAAARSWGWRRARPSGASLLTTAKMTPHRAMRRRQRRRQPPRLSKGGHGCASSMAHRHQAETPQCTLASPCTEAVHARSRWWACRRARAARRAHTAPAQPAPRPGMQPTAQEVGTPAAARLRCSCAVESSGLRATRNS